jgi:hypothetical protein
LILVKSASAFIASCRGSEAKAALHAVNSLCCANRFLGTSQLIGRADLHTSMPLLAPALPLVARNVAAPKFGRRTVLYRCLFDCHSAESRLLIRQLTPTRTVNRRVHDLRSLGTLPGPFLIVTDAAHMRSPCSGYQQSRGKGPRVQLGLWPTNRRCV